MDIEEYKKIIAEIDNKARQDKFAVAREYALANNTVKVGDVISDHKSTILVDNIIITASVSSKPMCVYDGIKLKKDGTPVKSGERDTVYQSNLRVM
jgi:hypothetical protein